LTSKVVYLSTSDSFFLLCSPQQHFSALTAKRMKRVKRRMVKTQPTTTAMAIKISGDKCSAKKTGNLLGIISRHFLMVNKKYWLLK
jgi:hypothetical protein